MVYCLKWNSSYCVLPSHPPYLQFANLQTSRLGQSLGALALCSSLAFEDSGCELPCLSLELSLVGQPESAEHRAHSSPLSSLLVGLLRKDLP